MHRFALALLPLALLAGCGSEEPDAPPAPEPSALVANTPAPVQMPMPSPSGADTVDYSGSYTFTDLDGSQSTLTLDKDAGTYEYVSREGTTSGKYRKIDAGRIAIANFEGGTAYFSIAPGALYRLAAANSPLGEIDPGRMYRRSDYTVDAGPGAESSPAQSSARKSK